MLKNPIIVNNKMYQINFDIYKSLNEFINNYKIHFISKRQCKINNIIKNKYFECNFNDIFHNFITIYLYKWNIEKNEIVTIILYDDFITVYTKNKKFEYMFFEFE